MTYPLRIRHFLSILILPFNAAFIIPAIVLCLTPSNVGWGLSAYQIIVPIALSCLTIWLALAFLAFTIGLFIKLGEGTLAPWDPATEFIVAGPYRYVRNPMVIAILFVILGEANLFGSAPLFIYALAFLAANHLYFVFYEERELARRFGKKYQTYAENVPRWIPRLRPWGKISRKQTGSVQKYALKINYGIFALGIMIVSAVFISIEYIQPGFINYGLITTSVLAVLIINYFIRSTEYVITETHLIVALGWLEREIAIDAIEEIFFERMFRGAKYGGFSAAYDPDQTIVRYRRNGVDQYVYLSLTDQESFAQNLTSKNPSIQVTEET